jgi:hypothetical protein
MMATVALAAMGALSVGCGPAPGYEPEPRMPGAYTPPVGESYPEPATSEELEARAQNAQAAQGDQVAPNANGEIAVGAETAEYTDTDPSALTEFKPALDGHGQWVDDPTYGTIWVPAETEVGSDFVPYTTAGHWTYADDTSWVWVSDYSWGWAPFHYGRWVHVRHHGWAWIPGRTYSGAWVVWRTGPGYDYVGWAPAGPDWYWYNGYAVGWTFGYSPYYSYCHHDYLYSPRLGGYVVRGNDPRSREYEAHTRPFVAAAPTVGGSGRVAATPTVGGAGAGGRIAASPRVGPRPAELGIRNERVVPPPGDHPGLARASALASPSTAVVHGAAPPVTVPRRRVEPDAIAAAPQRSWDARAPASSSRFDAVARAPQVQGVSPVPPRPYSPPASAFDARSSSRSFGSTPSQSAPSVAQPAPSFRTPPTSGFAQQQPRVAPSPSPPPTYRSSPPSFSQPSPSYRSSAPSFSQPSPSYRPSAPSFSQPSPSYRPSAPSFSQPSPSFRSSAPAVRSTPSYSAPRSAPAPARPATPSRSSAPAVRSRR